MIHYSVSREELLAGHDPQVLPDLALLKEQGKRMKFAYRPSGNPSKIQDYRFDNMSGNMKN